MAITYRIDTEDGIVHLETTGNSSLEEWTEIMLAMLADPAYRPGLNFLSDRREQVDVPSKEWARGTADFLIRHRGEMGEFRWAAVSNEAAIYRMQRMFSIVSGMNGISAEVFSDFEEARAWLLHYSVQASD